MNAPAHIISDTFVNIVIDSKSYTIEKEHPNFDEVKQVIKNQDWDGIIPLIDIGESLVKFTAGNIVVEDGAVFYKNKGIHNVITDKIIAMMKEGYDYKPLTRFLDNLMRNPSKRAVDELYGFLETTRLPISEDGHFLAYKSVRSDYMDGYTGTIDNSVGEVVTMERHDVTDNKDITCSQGLHFCSLEYVRDFGWGGKGRHIMIVKIDPADVVSIPTDYNNSKGRCCRYEVVGENDGEVVADVFDKEVYTDTDVNRQFNKPDHEEYVEAGGAKAYEAEPEPDEPTDNVDESDSDGSCDECEKCFYCDQTSNDDSCDDCEQCDCPRCGDCGDITEDCVCDLKVE